ncbi:MAG TPA: carboxypeptidase-like regulatory domain-containing protein, partial [Polyangiaceae bacterium]|nr:carboxypeptidase-like regulatory domain-containing protein [Polyangiaceae bacterium]
TRTLRGRVVNGESGAPEEAALVEVMGLGEPATVTDPAGEFSIAAVPGPNIQVHASKYVGMDASGALYEGIACYRPDPSVAAPDGSELLQRVDCQDFTTPLDPEGVLHDTVEVVLGPPPAQYRRVTLTGFAQITDCDCCGFETCPDRGSANLFAECRVGPGDEEVTFVIGQDVMCADEVGVRLEATCRLEGDNAVRVSGSATLFESGEGTCGASVAEHTRDFDVLVREGESREFGLGGTLVHDDICQAGPFPFDCDDRAELHRLTLINETAE